MEKRHGSFGLDWIEFSFLYIFDLRCSKCVRAHRIEFVGCAFVFAVHEHVRPILLGARRECFHFNVERNTFHSFLAVAFTSSFTSASSRLHFQ